MRITRRIIGQFWIPILIVVLISPVCFLAWRIYIHVPGPTDFCTTQDEVYQEILRNSQDWESLISPKSVQWRRSIDTIEVNGRGYIVRAGMTIDDVKIFYVATTEDWPAIPEGLKGYMYTSSGQIPPNYWPPIYNTKHLAGNIYCYSKYEIK